MSSYLGPNIITDGLVLYLDSTNPKSYSGSGADWNDLVTNTLFTSSNYSWANNITAITIQIFLEKMGTSTNYASHPVNKWNTGTGNASFVLYHFGNYLGNGQDGNFSFYYTCDTYWNGQYVTTLVTNQKAHIILQYNSTTGGQVWCNGSKVGGRANTGTLGVGGSSALLIPAGPQSDGLAKVHNIGFYNRELTDNEISQNYNALKSRYGI